MTISTNIQEYLKEYFGNSKLKRKDLIEQTKIPSNTFAKLIKTNQSDVGLKTLLKLANFFNTSLDEVIGRKTLAEKNIDIFNQISLEDSNIFLKDFLQKKMKEASLNPFQLAKKCGLGEVTLHNFIKNAVSEKMLSTNSLVSVADYFNVSLDEMIGRSSPSNKQTQEIPPSSLRQQLIPKLNQKDLEEIENIRTSLLKQQNIAPPKSSNSTSTPKIDKNTNKTLDR